MLFGVLSGRRLAALGSTRAVPPPLKQQTSHFTAAQREAALHSVCPERQENKGKKSARSIPRDGASTQRGFPLHCILQRRSGSLVCARAPGAPGVPRGMWPQHPPCLWVSSCQSPSEHSHCVHRALPALQPQRVRNMQEEGSRTDTLTQNTGSLQVSEQHSHHFSCRVKAAQPTSPRWFTVSQFPSAAL